jgi:bacillithiol biosynthesis cysteine-adding enzyme BshC
MPSRSEPAAAAAAIRDAIAVSRLPWIRPLVGAYANDFGSVAPLFAGNPADPAAWRETIGRVQRASRDRARLASLLAAQQDRRGAPDAARRNAARFADPATVAVVTGQQAGVFGGPLYTVLKAVTTIQLTRLIEREHGVAAVPVFWVEAEDHDWEEVRTATVLDRDFTVASLTLHALEGAGERPVGSLKLDAGIDQMISALEQLLAPTEFTTEVLGTLRRRYADGAPLGTACAGWFDDLLGRHGLVVFESNDPAAKPVAADLFARELANPSRAAALVAESAAEMLRLGHAPQVEPAADAVCLFYVSDAGRQPIKRQGADYLIGETVRPASDLAAEASAHPERFSPNVLLRPLVQDRLFPTVCYVGGPSELAYQAELGPLYREMGVERPLLASRTSATLVDSAAGRFLDRHDVPYEAFQAQDELALNKLLESQLPPSVDRAIEAIGEYVGARADELKATVERIDPTLAGVIDTTFDRIRGTLDTMQTKIVQASKKKDDTLRRQFIRTRALLFPDGHPQERLLNVAFFVNRYGLTIGDRLLDALPPALDAGRAHYIVSL